jgi:hypothetical protein
MLHPLGVLAHFAVSPVIFLKQRTSHDQHRIAVIPGDGIGKEVMPEGLRVMDAAARKFGIDLQFDHFDFSSWDYFEKHGQMLPDNWKDQIGGHDAIYFGAVGWPDKIADHVSLWGSLLLFRREFDQYINLRPARLMPGIIAPVVRRDGSARQPGEIDMYIVRENTEGEYSSVGGRMFPGTEREIVMQESIMTRIGVDRVLKFAFELAQTRPEKAPDQRHQIQRHRHHHALLGRARGRDGQGYPGINWTSSTSTSSPRTLCSAPTFLMWWWPAICLATSSAIWARLHRHHRHCAQRQPEPGPQIPLACLSRCMARRPTLRAKALPTRLDKFGAAP